ncbi:MAG: hypothetical protein ABGX04_16145 [Myxococcales bacterium]|nr:hypothetical protein [Myxococcales bacterium]HIL80703.1 hypothetical protein [Myxococcales bacterium]
MSNPGPQSAFRRLGSSSGLFLLLASVALWPGTLSADGDEYSKARKASAENLEDHEAKSSDPSDHEAESGEMQPGYSEDPEDLVVDSDEMDVVETEDLADHRGSSTDLQDLKTEAPEDGFEAIDDGRLKGIDDVNLSAPQLVAKRHLERAQTNAQEARTRYGDMMRDNYPRGKPRLRITEHRDQTMQVLEKTRADFDRAMGN